MYAEMVWLTVGVAMIGKFLISMTFAIAYLYTAELFPTNVRNVAVGTASTFARIGSISAPYIVDLLVYFQMSMAIDVMKNSCCFVHAGLCSRGHPRNHLRHRVHERRPPGSHATRDPQQEVARERHGGREIRQEKVRKKLISLNIFLLI